MKKSLLILLVAVLALSLKADNKTFLYVLSGQSNMNHVDAGVFEKIVKKEFPKDEIIVEKFSKSGRPIKDWDETWVEENGKTLQRNGRLYRMLMEQVNPAITNKNIDVTTFIWMQGEANAKSGADQYEASLKKLLAKVEKDTKTKKFNFVIGRISDYGKGNEEERPQWETIRNIQMKVADEAPNGVWVNCDDLNGPKDGLHYTKEGYEFLTKRFAEKSIELTKNSIEPPKPTN